MFSYPQVVDNFVNKRKRYEMMTNIKPHGPLPSQAQLDYLEDELAAFIHFGPNTFYDQEWGSGQEDPMRFNPTKLDAREWVRVLKETGFKKLILVVKHHDGFVLYPTAHTDYSIKASPWRDGKGDLLLEVSKAATEFDMDLGVYLSPWDAHSPLYHVDREANYNAYYLAQLKEILSNPAYGNAGKFAEVWMDGARGEGAQKVNYEFETWFETIRDLQGDCLIFSTEGTSIRWIGNERGYAGDPLWQKVKPDQLGTEAELDYLQHGDPSGTLFSIGEADVSLRPGWFYHEDQDPKSLEELVEIYFHSVGRGTPLLLNIPPNQDGLFDEKDIQRLYEFAVYRDEFYKEDLALGAKVSGPALSPDFACHHLAKVDDKVRTWYFEKGVIENNYYLVVGRFVPENNYEAMIRGFMASSSDKDFVLITNVEENKFYDKLRQETGFDKDPRVKFVGTVYDQELLKYIRENAFAYFHGHEVGGTNPSLLEALESTKLNLLLDVGFNREVGEDGALYWKKDQLASVIDQAEQLDEQAIEDLNQKSSKRIAEAFTWEKIVTDYEKVFKG